MKKKTANSQKKGPETQPKKNYFGGLKKLIKQTSKSPAAKAAAVGTAAYFGNMEKLIAGFPT